MIKKENTQHVMQQALDALIAMQMEAKARSCGLRICDEAITSLQEALAPPIITDTEVIAACKICSLWVTREAMKDMRRTLEAFLSARLGAAQTNFSIRLLTDKICEIVDTIRYHLEQDRLDDALLARITLEDFLYTSITQKAYPEQLVGNLEIGVGAIYDFVGYLTTRKEQITLSWSDDAAPAVEVITEFLDSRGISNSVIPAINSWSKVSKPTYDI